MTLAFALLDEGRRIKLQAYYRMLNKAERCIPKPILPNQGMRSGSIGGVVAFLCRFAVQIQTI
jgi:hypothetical protein